MQVSPWSKKTATACRLDPRGTTPPSTTGSRPCSPSLGGVAGRPLVPNASRTSCSPCNRSPWCQIICSRDCAQCPLHPAPKPQSSWKMLGMMCHWRWTCPGCSKLAGHALQANQAHLGRRRAHTVLHAELLLGQTNDAPRPPLHRQLCASSLLCAGSPAKPTGNTTGNTTCNRSPP